MKTVRGVFVGRDTFHYGWIVKATVNAKNSFGGYVLTLHGKVKFFRAAIEVEAAAF